MFVQPSNDLPFICFCSNAYPLQFAICAAAKDQNADALEWLEYHKSIGVSKVYWMDNNSTVSALETILYAHASTVYVILKHW